MSNDQSSIDERAQSGELGELDEALESHLYPTTSAELIESYGNYKVESSGGSKSVEEIFTPIDNETYTSSEEVRNQVLELLHLE